MIHDSVIFVEGSQAENLTLQPGTEAERLALVSPQVGELFYQTDGTAGNYSYDGTNWNIISGSQSSVISKLTTINANQSNSALSNNGKLYTWGQQGYGELGLGTTTQTYDTPQEVQLPFNETGTIVNAALTAQQGYALTSTGNLYSWGRGSTGTLGHGDTANQSTPKKVAAFNGTVSEMILGIENGQRVNDRATIVKLTNGEYWACGANHFGQLGTGNITQQNSFFQIVSPDPGGSPITNVWVLGTTFGAVMLKTANNKIWATGYNNHGTLGLGHTVLTKVFTEVTYFTSNGINIVDIQGGYGYFASTTITNGATIFLDDAGNVYSTGNNQFGQLGNGTVLNANTLTPAQVTLTKPVSEIHACGGGPMTVYCKNTDGTYVRWGYNAFGQLADGTIVSSGTPIQSTTQIDKIFNTGAMDTFSYLTSIWILQSDGILMATGRNAIGQLGIGTNTDSLTFQPIFFNDSSKIIDIRRNGSGNDGSSITLLTSEGKIYTCGYGQFRALGIAGSTAFQTTFRRILI